MIEGLRIALACQSTFSVLRFDWRLTRYETRDEVARLRNSFTEKCVNCMTSIPPPSRIMHFSRLAVIESLVSVHLSKPRTIEFAVQTHYAVHTYALYLTKIASTFSGSINDRAVHTIDAAMHPHLVRNVVLTICFLQFRTYGRSQIHGLHHRTCLRSRIPKTHLIESHQTQLAATRLERFFFQPDLRSAWGT